MVTMVNATDRRVRTRRGAELYDAEPGATVEAAPRDVDYLRQLGFEPAESPAYAGMTKAQLAALAEQRGVTVASGASKAEIIAALTTAQE